MDIRDHGLNPVRPEVFDSSMVNDFLRCPAYFYLRHVLGLRPKSDGEVSHLSWGTKWHEAMYDYHVGYDLDAAVESLDPWPDILNETDRHGRTYPRMILLLEDYHNRYADRDKARVEVLRREQYFDVMLEAGDPTPWGEPSPVDFRWCGRMDKIKKDDGREIVVDYKTSSRMSANYVDQHKHGVQIPGYIFAGSMLIGKFIKTAEIDVAYCLKNDHDFFRLPIRYTPDHMSEWLTNTKKILDNMNAYLDDGLVDPTTWPQHRNACFEWGRLCDFGAAHHTPNFGGDTRWQILADEFVEDRWDPAALVED